MNRRYARPLMCLMFVTLAGLLVACGVGPPDAGGATWPATTPRVGPEAEASPPATSDAATSPTEPPASNVYYVAVDEPGASDDNNGLYPTYQGGQDGPWLTIQRAASTMTAGDTAYVQAGTYYESGISFAHSGEPAMPITLASYPSEYVVIDGSRAADGRPGIGIMEGRGHYVIQGLTIRHMDGSGIATDENATAPYRDITIRDCVLHDNGWSGIDLAAVDGFAVEHVEAYDNAYYGLDIISSEDGALSAANGAVRNSSFHDHTGDEGHGLAINQGHHITVSDCTAYHNTIHGFDVSDWPKRGELSHHITFERSFSYDNGVAGFAINSDSHHIVYWHNVAWRNGADWAGRGSSSGFLCYEGCWHVEWYHNVSLENTDAGFWVEDQLGIYGTPDDNLLVFNNNITHNNGRPEWEERPALVIEGGNTWQVFAAHNDWSVPLDHTMAVYDQGAAYTPAEINGGAFQTGNISVDPQFVDPTAPDVHLRPGSPCIDAGVDVGLPYLGVAPDMGALEFGAPSTDDPLIYAPSIFRSQAPPEVAGCAVFPADNVWNAPVDGLPVDSHSDAYVATIGADDHVHADFGSGTWDGGPIGIPYVDVPGTQQKVDVAFVYNDESDPGPYPIPPDAPIEGGPDSTGDRHVLVLERDACVLYELFDAWPQPDGSWHAGSGAIFDLRSNALRPEGWTSADAAGLPILPGLVRYDEVAQGEIRHALRFTVPQTRKTYVWPARHYASSLTGMQYPPMGQRFRLRAGFGISGFSPEVQVILRALKRYGMILADNGSAWFISGAPDEGWDNDVLRELHQVRGSDFEAVDVSSLMVDPDSGQVRGRAASD